MRNIVFFGLLVWGMGQEIACKFRAACSLRYPPGRQVSRGCDRRVDRLVSGCLRIVSDANPEEWRASVYVVQGSPDAIPSRTQAHVTDNL